MTSKDLVLRDFSTCQPSKVCGGRGPLKSSMPTVKEGFGLTVILVLRAIFDFTATLPNQHHSQRDLFPEESIRGTR